MNAGRPPSLRDASGHHTMGDDPRESIQGDHDDAFERAQRRRDELEDRLENLDQRVNQAKVSLGLGRISHAGYRQYVKEVERERTLIESELMNLRGHS